MLSGEGVESLHGAFEPGGDIETAQVELSQRE